MVVFFVANSRLLDDLNISSSVADCDSKSLISSNGKLDDATSATGWKITLDLHVFLNQPTLEHALDVIKHVAFR
jgi:hypothetical protein